MDEPARPSAEPRPAAPPALSDEARALHALALERQHAGDLAGAIEAYCRCLERFPSFADAYNNLAVVLKLAGRVPAAIACLKRAINLVPQAPTLHSNLGNLQWMALDFEAALGSFQRALALDPARYETYHNLGLLYYSLGNFQTAVECYDRAIALKPDMRLVRWDRALALLAGGDLVRGFAAYDERFDLIDPSMGFDRKLQNVRSIPMPIWNGEDVSGRTVWIYSEQGIGDTLQFVRLLPALAARGARIIFDCQPDLVRLLAGFPGVGELRPEGSPPPGADFHLPLLSLPHRLGIALDNIPTRVPYITPPATGPGVARPAGTCVAAGICWAGRPQHTNDRNRSIPFEHFLELCDLPGLALYSLQKGARARDIADHGAQALVRDLAPALHDFADTARLISELDLVITVDTAVAHLSGALGRPTLLLLPYTADWRWLGRREDTPWYPSLRLVRQDAPRDWEGPMRRIHDLLTGTLAARR